MNTLKNNDSLDEFELQAQADALVASADPRSYWLDRYVDARKGLTSVTLRLYHTQRVARVYGAVALVGWVCVVLLAAGVLPAGFCA